MSLVGLVKIQNNSIASINRSISEALDQIDYHFDQNVQNIVIKPNMCYYWDYTTGHTTDPKFIAALIDLIREKVSKTANIAIVESDASAMKCKYAFRVLGYEKLAQEYNVNLVNLSEEETENIPININGNQFDFKLPNIIKNADLKINIPKPKYMDQTIITCALKNIFGCNPEPLKYKLHPHLNEAIVGLNLIMKFNLTILDGLIVAGASPRKLDLIMASQDPVAIDSAVAKIMGENPKRIKHLQLAQKAGLGNINYIPKGDNPEHFKKEFPKKTAMTKFLTSGYKTAIKIGLIKTD